MIRNPMGIKQLSDSWKPFNLIIINTFAIDDIQRLLHPGMQNYTYELKSLKVRSRMDFFLVAKNVTQFVKKSEIDPPVAPNHHVIYLLLSWTNEIPRGPDLWKFNNTPLKDNDHIRSTKFTLVLLPST